MLCPRPGEAESHSREAGEDRDEESVPASAILTLPWHGGFPSVAFAQPKDPHQQAEIPGRFSKTEAAVSLGWVGAVGDKDGSQLDGEKEEAAKARTILAKGFPQPSQYQLTMG